MNTNDIREYLLSHSPWVDRARTVDTVKAGDPTREVHTVGVGWMATMDNLRAAHALRCELFITHEPTFWEHGPEETTYRAIEPGLSKQRWLDETGMIVLRAHDTWDNWPGIGIRDSWARGLGLTEFAQYIAQRIKSLGEDSVRVMGDPQMRVSRPSLGVGCGGPDKDMADLGSDVLIVCYDGASYWQRRERFAELGVGVIVVEHGTSEMWGLENLAKHLAATFPLTVHYLDRHPRPWTVMG